MVERCSDYMPEDLKKYKDDFLKYYVYGKFPENIDKGKFEGFLARLEKEFFSDFYFKLRSGFKELKVIAKAYNFDISFNSEVSLDNLILLCASYNRGYGKFKVDPLETLLQVKETEEYVRTVLALMSTYDRFVVSKKKKIFL